MCKRMYIYSKIDPHTNSYETDGCNVTDDYSIAMEWIKAGCEQIAILDALSLEYYGYLDSEDLYEWTTRDELNID